MNPPHDSRQRSERCDFNASTKIMKTIWKAGVVSCGIVLSSLLTGCVAVLAGAAGAGTVAWVQGRLDAELAGNFDRSEHAASRAMEQLQFAKISETHDALTAVIQARTIEDTKIEIKILRVSDATSRAQIRVGVFGNEALSLTILDKIKANL